jgi:hypothetical protein
MTLMATVLTVPRSAAGSAAAASISGGSTAANTAAPIAPMST